MNATEQLDLARRHLHRYELTNTVTYRGLTLDHFTAEELRKIVEISRDQSERELKFYKTSVDGFQTLNQARRETLKETP